MSSSGHPTRSERLARVRLEPLLGPLRQSDIPGRPGTHDLESLEMPPLHAVEVTSEVDGLREAQITAMRNTRWVNAGTDLDWHLYLSSRAHVRDLLGPKLRRLLEMAEARGLRRLPDVDTTREIEQLQAELRVEFASAAVPSVGRVGTVHWSAGMTFGTSQEGDSIDEWLSRAFASRLRQKVTKLERSSAARKHLYIELSSNEAFGFGVALALESASDGPYVLPTFVPPEPLTDLWLWPESPGPGLHYLRDRGWVAVLPESGWQPGDHAYF